MDLAKVTQFLFLSHLLSYFGNVGQILTICIQSMKRGQGQETRVQHDMHMQTRKNPKKAGYVPQ